MDNGWLDGDLKGEISLSGVKCTQNPTGPLESYDSR